MRYSFASSILLLAAGYSATNAFVSVPIHKNVGPVPMALRAASVDSASVESAEFPPPLSKVDRLKRAAQFWSTAVPIIASYYGKSLDLKLRGTLGSDAFIIAPACSVSNNNMTNND